MCVCVCNGPHLINCNSAATLYDTLQHTATHYTNRSSAASQYNTLQHATTSVPALHLLPRALEIVAWRKRVALFRRGTVFSESHTVLCQLCQRCNTLQQTATPYNTLQHSATLCKTLQQTATPCNTLQHTATSCNQRCSSALLLACVEKGGWGGIKNVVCTKGFHTYVSTFVCGTRIMYTYVRTYPHRCK